MHSIIPLINLYGDIVAELLNDMDITKELDQLQQQRALGHAKHRKQVCSIGV